MKNFAAIAIALALLIPATLYANGSVPTVADPTASTATTTSRTSPADATETADPDELTEETTDDDPGGAESPAGEEADEECPPDGIGCDDCDERALTIEMLTADLDLANHRLFEAGVTQVVEGEGVAWDDAGAPLDWQPWGTAVGATR